MNSRLGRYTLLEQLGNSASGKVFRAYDPIRDQEVAIRTLDADLPDKQKEEFKRRFFAEARTATRLLHPNIVAMLDAGEDGGTSYVVSEFIVGQSLASILRGSTLPFSRTLSLVTQLAAGLAYAHADGIVHRGIKPSCLLLGKDGSIRIADFGVIAIAESSISRIGQILNAPNYIAPEQIQGRSVDARTDLYGLGAVFYEMITGQAAFACTDAKVHKVLQAIVGSNPVKPSVLKPGLPDGVDEIIDRLMAKDPAARFQSAEQLLQALHRLTTMNMSGEPEAAITAPSTTPTSDAAWRVFEESLNADIDAFKERLDEQLATPDKTPTTNSRLGHSLAFPTLNHADPVASGDGPATPSLDSVLDSLKSTAQQLREQEREIAARLPMGKDEPGRDTDRRLAELFEFLDELTRQLNVLKPQINRPFRLPAIGTINEPSWQRGAANFRLRDGRLDSPIELVSLNYTLTGPGSFELTRDASTAAALRNNLFALDIAFTEEPATNGMLGFRIPETIKASASFRSNTRSGMIELQLTNVEKLGLVRYVLTPNALSQPFFEEFGRLVLAQANRIDAYLTAMNSARQTDTFSF